MGSEYKSVDTKEQRILRIAKENNIITPDSAEQGQTLQVFISGDQYEFENWSGCGSWNNGVFVGILRLKSNSGIIILLLQIMRIFGNIMHHLAPMVFILTLVFLQVPI